MTARRSTPWLANVPPRINADVGGSSFSFRSKLELAVAEDLEDRGAEWVYEFGSIDYIKKCRYIPDFLLAIDDNCEAVIECKGWTPGWASGADRSKMIAVRQQHPGLIICIVWDTARFASAPISKGAKTSNEEWARTHGFPQAVGVVPEAWLNGVFE